MVMTQTLYKGLYRCGEVDVVDGLILLQRGQAKQIYHPTKVATGRMKPFPKWMIEYAHELFLKEESKYGS